MATPFFRGNYGSALGRVDTRPIIEAGRAQGQMFAQAGAQIGNMIQQYGLNKQKRDKAEAAFQGDFGRVMQDNPEQLAEMQADPVIGPTLKKIQEGKGSLPDFDKYNAYRAADKQAELDTLRTKSAELQGIAQTLMNENRRLGNEFDKDTMGSRKRIVGGQANVAEAAGDYASEQEQANLAGKTIRTAGAAQAIQQSEEMFPLEKKNIESLIRSRDLNSFYNAMGMSGKTLPDLEKRFSEISTLIDKNDNSLIKVKTKGALGGTFGGGEEVQITFGEYKKDRDNYAPMITERIQTLEANEARLIQEQTDAMLNTPMKAKDNETGEEIGTTLAEIMALKAEQDRLLQLQQNQPSTPAYTTLEQQLGRRR
jgi:hypothetical protein